MTSAHIDVNGPRADANRNPMFGCHDFVLGSTVVSGAGKHIVRDGMIIECYTLFLIWCRISNILMCHLHLNQYLGLLKVQLQIRVAHNTV